MRQQRQRPEPRFFQDFVGALVHFVPAFPQDAAGLFAANVAVDPQHPVNGLSDKAFGFLRRLFVEGVVGRQLLVGHPQALADLAVEQCAHTKFLLGLHGLLFRGEHEVIELSDFRADRVRLPCGLRVNIHQPLFEAAEDRLHFCVRRHTFEQVGFEALSKELVHPSLVIDWHCGPRTDSGSHCLEIIGHAEIKHAFLLSPAEKTAEIREEGSLPVCQLAAGQYLVRNILRQHCVGIQPCVSGLMQKRGLVGAFHQRHYPAFARTDVAGVAGHHAAAGSGLFRLFEAVENLEGRIVPNHSTVAVGFAEVLKPLDTIKVEEFGGLLAAASIRRKPAVDVAPFGRILADEFNHLIAGIRSWGRCALVQVVHAFGHQVERQFLQCFPDNHRLVNHSGFFAQKHIRVRNVRPVNAPLRAGRVFDAVVLRLLVDLREFVPQFGRRRLIHLAAFRILVEALDGRLGRSLHLRRLRMLLRARHLPQHPRCGQVFHVRAFEVAADGLPVHRVFPTAGQGITIAFGRLAVHGEVKAIAVLLRAGAGPNVIQCEAVELEGRTVVSRLGIRTGNTERSLFLGLGKEGADLFRRSGIEFGVVYNAAFRRVVGQGQVIPFGRVFKDSQLCRRRRPRDRCDSVSGIDSHCTGAGHEVIHRLNTACVHDFRDVCVIDLTAVNVLFFKAPMASGAVQHRAVRKNIKGLVNAIRRAEVIHCLADQFFVRRESVFGRLEETGSQRIVSVRKDFMHQSVVRFSPRNVGEVVLDAVAGILGQLLQLDHDLAGHLVRIQLSFDLPAMCRRHGCGVERLDATLILRPHIVVLIPKKANGTTPAEMVDDVTVKAGRLDKVLCPRKSPVVV